MRIKVNAETKWQGCSESEVIDTNEVFGLTDEEWDNLSDFEKLNMIQELAHEMIDFSFSYGVE